jgi:hypothetical protein
VRLSKGRPFRETPGRPLVPAVIPSPAGGRPCGFTEHREQAGRASVYNTNRQLPMIIIGATEKGKKKEDVLLGGWNRNEKSGHTSNSCMLPFSRIWSTASSSLEVPNSFSSIAFDAPSSKP